MQSFQLQPTSTPGTFYLQTTSPSATTGLPLSTVSPSPHQHIILHSLAVSLPLPTAPPPTPPSSHPHDTPLPPLQADGLCSNDGVIIQTVTSDPASAADTLSQSQLVVAADQGQSQDHQLAATSLLEGSEGVATETQEPITDHFSHKVQTQTFTTVLLI